MVGLLREVSTSPVSSVLIGLVKEVGLGGRDKIGELSLILGTHLLDDSNSGSLLVHKSADGSLGLDNDVRNTHLAAKSGEEDNKLDRVDVGGNDNKTGLLGLNEGDTVVETVLHKKRLLAIGLGVSLLAVGNILGGSSETGLLLLLGLGSVLVEQFEQVCGRVLVKGVSELRNRRGNLQALVQNNLLSLQTNIFGPLDESSKVSGRLNVLACGGIKVMSVVGLLCLDDCVLLTDTEVSGLLFEERVLGSLVASFSLGVGSSGGLLGRSGLSGFGLKKKNTTNSKRKCSGGH